MAEQAMQSSTPSLQIVQLGEQRVMHLLLLCFFQVSRFVVLPKIVSLVQI